MRGKLLSLLGFSLLVRTLIVPGWAQQNIDPRILAYADIVFYNGKILTADDRFTIVEAVAIRDGQFLARGSTPDILGLAGPNTLQIDLEGKTAVPGFIEPHQGLGIRSALQGRIVFNSLEEGLEQLRRQVEGQPSGKTLQFSSFQTKTAMNVTRWDLDRVTPENPVVLSFSTYEYNMNSLALKILLDHLGTEDFPGVVKDAETGQPNGLVRGLASGVFTYELLPWPENMEELKAQQLEDLKELTSQGVTLRIGRAPGSAVSLLRDLWVEGKLPLRVRVTHELLRDNPEPEKFLKRIGNLTGLGDDWLKIIGTGVQHVDGSSAAGAILTSRPKLHLAPEGNHGPYGQDRWEEYSNARQTLQLAARYGWKISTMHSYGDRSTLQLLKAYEEASAGQELPGGSWVVNHNYMGTEETIALMKKLNVIPSIVPWWLRDGEQDGQGGFTPQMGGAIVYMYGADWLNNNWSLGRSFIEAGLRPVAQTGPPLHTIEAFITRKDDKGRVWAPQEKVSRQQALWMKTRWAAYISGDQDKLGSIEEGKLADLVVLGGDYLAVPEEEISDLPVLVTLVGGKVMYERDP